MFMSDLFYFGWSSFLQWVYNLFLIQSGISSLFTWSFMTLYFYGPSSFFWANMHVFVMDFFLSYVGYEEYLVAGSPFSTIRKVVGSPFLFARRRHMFKKKTWMYFFSWIGRGCSDNYFFERGCWGQFFWGHVSLISFFHLQGEGSSFLLNLDVGVFFWVDLDMGGEASISLNVAVKDSIFGTCEFIF